jgi:DNA-binding transcriptional regulator LsrR (DeoR family)
MARRIPNFELRLLNKVSKLYYETGLTQDKIVEKMQLSRSKVSRLLQQARDVGIVKITVISPPGVYSDMEIELEKRFHLKDAVIVEVSETDSQSAVAQELGIAAASYLNRIIRDGDTIGISWGTTLHNMVDAMHPDSLPDARVVQIIGGIGRPESEAHAMDLCRRMSRLMNSRLTLLPAPGIVDNQRVKEVFLSDSHVERALELFPGLDFAVVGIGSPTPTSVMMRDGSIISQEELKLLLDRGSVGDIALRFFDIHGMPIPSGIDDRVIGITLEQLRQVTRVIGVSGGPEKLQALQGALNGQLINVLITDHISAQKLLQSC